MDGRARARGARRQRRAARPRLRIGLQDSCHLRNGMGVWREPRELLARIGEYVELPSAAACCGAAGSYSVLRPKDSASVLDPHLDEIDAADLDVIAVVNAGCYRQLEQGIKRRKLRTRVVHIAELLAESDIALPQPANGHAEITPAIVVTEVHAGPRAGTETTGAYALTSPMKSSRRERGGEEARCTSKSSIRSPIRWD